MLPRIFVLLAVIVSTSLVRAGEVIMNNGDRVTGDVTRVDDEKVTIENTPFGTITANRKDVKAFTTTQPTAVVTTRPATQPTTVATTSPATTTSTTTSPTTVAAAPISATPPPAPPKRWSGSVVATGLITRGNADTETYKLNADALRKGDNNTLTLAGGYAFGQQRNRDTGDSNATLDNWFGQVRYDHLLTDRFYDFALLRVEGDRIANLDVRAAPGLGVGYRWIISPEMNFNTEAGITWIYEQFSSNGSNEQFSVRTAYHFDKKINDKVSVVHNLEWIPAIGDPSDYILNTDAGIRALLTASLFTEFKVEWRRDTTPAPGAEKNDLRYTVGLGFKF